MYQAILDKYETPPAPEVEPDHEPVQVEPPVPARVFDTSQDAWKQYTSVVILSAFLKENKEHGVRLVLLDGRPTLHFSPGIGSQTDAERLDVIDQAFDLLFAALLDLETLIATGQHVIPRHPGYGSPLRATGPSGGPGS